MTSLVVREEIRGEIGVVKLERVQVICPVCGQQVEAVARDGRVKGYCAVGNQSVDFPIETQRMPPFIPGHIADEVKLLEVVLSQQEIRELQRSLTFGPDAEALVYGAIVTEAGVLLRATGEEMDDLLGYIAAEANHDKNRHHRKVLGTVYDRIEALLEEYLARETGLRETEDGPLPEFSPEVQEFLQEMESRLSED